MCKEWDCKNLDVKTQEECEENRIDEEGHKTLMEFFTYDYKEPEDHDEKKEKEEFEKL